MKNKRANKKIIKMMMKTNKMMMKIKVRNKEVILDGKTMIQASFKQSVVKNALTNCATLRKFIRRYDQK